MTILKDNFQLQAAYFVKLIKFYLNFKQHFFLTKLILKKYFHAIYT